MLTYPTTKTLNITSESITISLEIIHMCLCIVERIYKETQFSDVFLKNIHDA